MSFREAITQLRYGMPSAAPKGKKKGHDPKVSLESALEAVATGEHHIAKKHALNAAKALHALTGSATDASKDAPC